jgi:hypothetical protein
MCVNGDTNESENESIRNDGDTSNDRSDKNDGSDDQFSDEAFD